jgi:hypothetical protein
MGAKQPELAGRRRSALGKQHVESDIQMRSPLPLSRNRATANWVLIPDTYMVELAKTPSDRDPEP